MKTPGIYTATLKGTKSGDAHITVTLNGNAFNVAGTTVTLTADSTNPDNGKSELTATPDTIVADGADKSVLKLILKDANDNLITGQNVVFITDPVMSPSLRQQRTPVEHIQLSSKELRRVLWL